jgi:hypothetical protein
MNWREERHQILAPWSIFLITGFFAVAFWIRSFISYETITFPTEKDILYHYLTQIIPFDSFLAKIISFLLVVIVAVITFFANNKYFFIKNKSALLIMFMVLLMGLNDPSHNLNPGIIGLTFLLFAFIRFLGMHGKLHTGARSFDIGLYISIGSLFYDRMLFFIPFFYVGFYMYQQLHIKNVLATFFGISFPYLLVGGICFLFNDFDNFAQRLPLSISYSADTHIGHIIYLGLLGFVTLFAFVNFISKFSNEKIKTRNTIFFVYILLAGSIVSLFFSTHFFLFEIPFISFFLGILFAQFFSNNTSRFARFLFYAFWAICIIWFLVSFIL